MVSQCAMYPPETKVCGPGGLQCVPGNASISAVCECIAGWTNYGDFASSPSGPCDMNILAVRILWGTMGGANLLGFMFSVWFIWRKLEGSTSRKEMQEKLDGNAWMVLYLGLSQLCFAISGALRVGDPLRFIIGGELLFTLISSFGMAFWWMSGLLYFSNLIAVAYKNLRLKSEEVKEQATPALESIRKILPCFYALVALISLLTFTLAIVNTSLKGTESVGKYDQIFTGIILFGLATMEIYFGVFALPRWLDSLIEDCKIALDMNVLPGKGAAQMSENGKEHLRSVVKKFSFFKREARRQGAINGVLSMVCGCWAYVDHKLSYIIPVLVLSATGVGILATWSLAYFSPRGAKNTGDSINKEEVEDHLSPKVAAATASIQDLPNT